MRCPKQATEIRGLQTPFISWVQQWSPFGIIQDAAFCFLISSHYFFPFRGLEGRVPKV